MKMITLLSISTLLFGLGTAVTHAGTVSVGTVQSMTNGPDLKAASDASQKATTLLGEKNYYAAQYQNIQTILSRPKSLSKAQHSCLTNTSAQAKQAVQDLWKQANAELTTLLHACGFEPPQPLGLFGQASKKCSATYIHPLNHEPLTTCSPLAAHPNSNASVCLTVDTSPPVVTLTPNNPVDYLAQAKACFKPSQGIAQ